MDFHTELIKITEFPPLDEYLLKKRSSELSKIGNSGQITVSINPSNLVELARLGERFAADSCVDKNNFKYVVAESFIPNKHIETHLVRTEAKPEKVDKIQTRAEVQPIIPQLIVRERPGITYKPIRESNYQVLSKEPSMSEVPNVEQKNIIRIPGPSQKKNLEVKKAKSIGKKTVKMPEMPEVVFPSKTLKKSKSRKTKKHIKTILRDKSAPRKEDLSNSSMSERKTVTWDEMENNGDVMKEHEIKRKEHLDKFKYQYPSYLKDKEAKTHQDSLNKLEKIVEEEKEFLHEKGIYTPTSSQASKYQKTYQELEQEIKNIKNMLDESNDKQGDAEDDEDDDEEVEENASIEYSYSSDEAKIDDDKWMKPRFKSSS